MAAPLPGRARRSPRPRFRLAVLAVALLAGCSGEVRTPEPARSGDLRTRVERVLPGGTEDRAGWVADIYAALEAQEIPATASNLCAVVAVATQESSFRADPEVPGLARMAWEEIDRRASTLGVPGAAVRFALQLRSPDGRSYAARIDAARTERELSEIFEDFIGMVPLGRRLFGDLNPVRTGGPMQVSVRFAEEYTRGHAYPYPDAGSIRHEVFTRRGGLYFGIAHLLDYPADYDKPLYRFADYNAGHYASRNAAFQRAVSIASGVRLELDGDLLDEEGGGPGQTELAVRSLAKKLDLDDGAIRRALEHADGPEFERSTLYRGVFALAEKRTGERLPRAVLPHIKLSGPKIHRNLTTAWFAGRVNGRYHRCLSRVGGA